MCHAESVRSPGISRGQGTWLGLGVTSSRSSEVGSAVG